jgi:cation diffusion facilitator family transporter
MTVPFSNWRRNVRALMTRGRPEYASMISLIACVILAAGSIVIGLVQRSLIVQTNGYIALIDIGNSLLFLAAVQRSTRRADVTFNYGYGKYESLAILVSANLLVVLTIFTLGEAVAFFRRPPVDMNSLLLVGWALLSFVVMRSTARLLDRYADRFHMPMLRYDAELWRVDSLMEIGVLVGIGAGAVLRALKMSSLAAGLDVAASILLILIALKVPIKHGREAFRQLLDRTLPDNVQYEILAIIAENFDRMCEFKSVHTRQSGKDIFIEIDLVMPYDYTLAQLYELEKTILDGLRGKFPTAIPRVYVTPCDGKCERDGVSYCPIKMARQRSA